MPEFIWQKLSTKTQLFLQLYYCQCPHSMLLSFSEFHLWTTGVNLCRSSTPKSICCDHNIKSSSLEDVLSGCTQAQLSFYQISFGVDIKSDPLPSFVDPENHDTFLRTKTYNELCNE